MRRSKTEIISATIIEVVKSCLNYLTTHPMQGRIWACSVSLGTFSIMLSCGISILLLTIKYTAAEIITIIEAIK